MGKEPWANLYSLRAAFYRMFLANHFGFTTDIGQDPYLRAISYIIKSPKVSWKKQSKVLSILDFERLGKPRQKKRLNTDFNCILYMSIWRGTLV
jgi:hypothetical protein